MTRAHGVPFHGRLLRGLPAALLVCALGGVAAHAQLVNEATATTETPGLINRAFAVSSTSDPNFSSNFIEVESHVVDVASVVSTVVSSADLSITKSAPDGAVLAGTVVTYTLTATNGGPSVATDVAISDTLPADVGFVSATPSAGGSCSTPPLGATGTVTCTWAGATGVGATRTVSIAVRMPDGPTVDTEIVNSASVSSATSDPVAADNTASALVAVVGTAVIPTLGSAGLVMLIVAMGLGGAWILRRW